MGLHWGQPSKHWSRDHTTSSVTAVLPPPGQRCGTDSLPEQLRNRTSPSDNSNDRWKSICLVSRAPALCVWTLRALTKNLFTYLLTDLLTCFVLFPARKFPSQTWNSKHPQKCHSLSFFSLITVKLLKRGYEMVVYHCLTYTILSHGWFLHDLVQWLGQ